MGPGFPNPFNFDLSELMRMLQSPGPVNMEVARSTAEATASLDLETGEQKADLPVAPEVARAFDDVVRAVQLSVADATEISATLGLSARTVDRRDWAKATLTGLEPVLRSLAEALGRGQLSPGAQPDAAQAMTPDALFGMLMQQLVPLLLGGWAGSMIGYLSHHALGQYDLPLPLSGDPAMSFVVHNVDAFAQEWSLPLEELRYAVALREVVRGAQRSVPWVRERLVRLAQNYVSAYEVQPGAIEEHFGGLDPSDPNAMAGLEQLSDPSILLGAMQSERQGPLLNELQRFVSVLEGYTDVVVAQLGERMAASHARIDEALRRQRLERGDAATFVDRLLGLELDRDNYEAGVAFCRGVLERSDGALTQLNRLWTREEMVPTASELAAPGLWLARIDLPES
jgi:putative hydrolase